MVKLKKNDIIVYIFIAIFGIAGIYLTFIAGDTNKYDRQTKAYRIDPNESYDSDGSMYQPIYYFKVKGVEYRCKSSTESSSYPSEDKNTVYYDSANPEKCKTEYEKSTSKFAGILCLIAAAVIVYFFVIRKPSKNGEENTQNQEINMDNNSKLNQEKVEKAIEVVEKARLIVKRVILGIIIVVLIIFLLFDTIIFKQTIRSKDYPEVTATLVNKVDEKSTVFDDYVYTFTDKDGVQQDIIVNVAKDKEPEETIKLKYNEKDPQDYYQEGSYMDLTGIIIYIVKVVVLILLIILFCNKKLLNKINLSLSH